AIDHTVPARGDGEESGGGDQEAIDAGPDHVMVHRAAGPTGSTLFIHNLAGRPCRLNLASLRDPEQHPLNCAADSDSGTHVERDALHVAGYGSRWIRLRRTIGG